MSDLTLDAALDVAETLIWERSGGLDADDIADRLRNRAKACQDLGETATAAVWAELAHRFAGLQAAAA